MAAAFADLVMGHGMTVAVVWGSEEPCFSIGWSTPLGPADSGYTLIFQDAPDPGDVEDPTEHPGIELVCLHCLLDDHPEIGRGLDLARRFGVADLDDDGKWVVGDLTRLALSN